MLFSVIVPIYNTELYIERCIDSIINQTYKNIEIILVDDESPDNSPKICDKYAEQDSRIIVIHKKNGGLSDARNAGLAIAKGEFVLFVDSDDYIEINTCEFFSKCICSNNDIIIGEAIVRGGVCDLSHIGAIGESETGVEYLLRAAKIGKAPMAAWLNVYRRKFLLENNLRFKCGILHEDEEFTPRAFLLADSVLQTEFCFYNYIIRSGSITTNIDKRRNIVDLFNTCLELEKLYNKLENNELRTFLLDGLVRKYLSLFQSGKLFRYGNLYIHRKFCLKNSYVFRTILKSILFAFSPILYWYVNKFTKVLGEKCDQFLKV